LLFIPVYARLIVYQLRLRPRIVTLLTLLHVVVTTLYVPGAIARCYVVYSCRCFAVVVAVDLLVIVAVVFMPVYRCVVVPLTFV